MIKSFKEFMNENNINIDYEYLLNHARQNTTATWVKSTDNTLKLKDFYKIETKSTVKGSKEEPNSGVLISYDGRDGKNTFNISEYVDSKERSYSFTEKDPKKFWDYVKKYFN